MVCKLHSASNFLFKLSFLVLLLSLMNNESGRTKPHLPFSFKEYIILTKNISADSADAIEKRILIYLLELEPNNPIFTKIGMLQDRIKQDLIQECRINPPDVRTIKRISPKSCKKWSKLDEKIFKQCITQYCRDLPSETKNEFKTNFMVCLNQANARLGLPQITL